VADCEVLVCDADSASAAHVAAIVTRAGTTARQCHSASECERVVAECHPRLVILAALLPDVDGFALTRRLRNLVPSIIMLSALHVPARALAAGADRFLSKPAASSTLKSVVREFVPAAAT
jgi:DNA-binding response OmpR family regulator